MHSQGSVQEPTFRDLRGEGKMSIVNEAPVNAEVATKSVANLGQLFRHHIHNPPKGLIQAFHSSLC